jgi:hypothetical protein
MAIRATAPTAGLRFWWSTDQENTVWIEESTEIARSALSAAATAPLLLLPPPFGRLASTISPRRRRELESFLGPDGLWLKFDLSGLISVRPRTPANKLKPPTPW